MRRLPTINHYATGGNALHVDLGNGVEVWFSYQTPVAFRTRPGTPVVRENNWGPTTGGHLNAIHPDKSIRVSGAEFEVLLETALMNADEIMGSR